MKFNESKVQSFKRLAAIRTNNTVRNIRLLGNLSNRHNYSYSEQDYKKIFATIENEVKLSKSRFLVTLNTKKKFRL